MDKFKETGIEPALIVKLVLVLVILLTVAFVSGVVIGKNGRRNVDRTSSDEEGINEKLSNCIFNSDELRGKYLKLRDAAREKGLLDENDAVNPRVICNSLEQKQVEKPVEQPQPVETKPAEKPEPTEKITEKPVETKPAEKPVEEPKPVEKNLEIKQEKPKPAEKPAEPKKTDKTKTIDEILAEKGAAPKKNDEKKCRFSIQIFAANSKDEAVSAGKRFKSVKTRVVGGDSKGKTWYKLRTGCFDSREEAEAELPKIKKLEKSAYIVSE